MTDPYQVLQIPPTASDDEVKAAYHELVRKYHPDNYNGNPLSDLATEKMQEINEAYDKITLLRQNAKENSRYDKTGNSSQFSDIRRLVNERRITEAEELLDGVPGSRRDAEWYFLKGTIFHFRGWIDDAYESYATACNMDPSNSEYKNAFSQLQWQRQNAGMRGGKYYGSPMGAGECSICDACAAMYCCNCLCNCLGRGGC